MPAHPGGDPAVDPVGVDSPLLPPSGLLDRHLSFLRALRQAGLPVSLAEDVDAVAALAVLAWDERDTVRAAYAATVVKRQAQRPTFDALFDVYFPRLVGRGAAPTDAVARGDEAVEGQPAGVRDNAAALREFRDRLAEALEDDEPRQLDRLATEMVGRFGAMPGRGPGMSSWSAYTANQRVAPRELADRLRAALARTGRTQEEAEEVAGRRISGYIGRVEDDARRRIAEEKGADHVADVVVRPSIDRVDFGSARRGDLVDMRREIQPLARRLATRLTREQHARRGGPLDFRRTVRASMSTGGVPLTTHHRPRRPHRNDLVVLCDVSGSVANFAQFTLLLVLALRDQFQQVRAFTFVDRVHEVTPLLRPGADPGQVLADLADSTSQATRWGRTDYGRAFTGFAREHGDALGPKSALLVLGDARSNYSDLALDVLQGMAHDVRHAWWLNPERRRNWDTGDSAAGRYGAIVPMVECRNLTQLGRFVTDVLPGGARGATRQGGSPR